MHHVPTPDVRELLLPLLACLPAAFLSPRPPPALLPLLSPILRQRVHIRTSAALPSPNNISSQTWLNLLTWSPTRAERLAEIVAELQLEPHPVSGELELFGDEDDPEAGKVRYRRLDSETLQARCEIREHRLAVVWVWCENDTGGVGLPSDDISGEFKSGWKVAEVEPLKDEDEDEDEEQEGNTRPELQWQNSVGEAEEAAANSNTSRSVFPSSELSTASRSNGASSVPPAIAPAEEEDDDDYWAAYDQTPNRTPAKHSPAPPTPQPTNTRTTRPTTTSAEDEYYARYGSVQPALDGHDPDEEEGTEELESTLHQQQDLRHEYSLPNKRPQQQQQQSIPSPPHSDGDEPVATTSAHTAPVRIHSPTPSRPSSSGSHSGGRRSPVAALELSAASASAAEVGVKQHISTEMKSLYRLARAAGIERSEFERVIRTELDVMSMMDQ